MRYVATIVPCTTSCRGHNLADKDYMRNFLYPSCPLPEKTLCKVMRIELSPQEGEMCMPKLSNAVG